MPELSLAEFEARVAKISRSGACLGNAQNVVLLRLFHYIAPRLTAHLNQSLATFGLQHNEWIALLAVYSEDGQQILPSRLSDILDLTRTSITRLSDDLVGKGLLCRRENPDDRRQIVLQLTGQGARLLEKIAPATQAKRQNLLAEFSEAEKIQFEQYLRRLLGSLEKQNV